MNFVFLYRNQFLPQEGGVQRVSIALAEYFQHKGNKVYYLSQKKYSDSILENQFFFPNDANIKTGENISFLSKFIKEHKIDIVFNQCGHDISYSNLLNQINNLPFLVSCIHCSILPPILNYYESHIEKARKYKVNYLLELLKFDIVKNRFVSYKKNGLRKIYKSVVDVSDIVSPLTMSAKNDITEILKKEYKHIYPIPNPKPFASTHLKTNFEKEILFVGNINTTYKRVDLLVKVWEKTFKEVRPWKLTVVGNGPSLKELQQHCKDNAIENIEFVGKKDPTKYYKRASIICMTSTTEGLSMTLLEALNFGLVPVVFDSYLGVREVIQHDFNGLLIPAFDLGLYAKSLIELCNNQSIISQLSKNAQLSSEKYTIETIGDKWLDLLINNIKINNESYISSRS